MYTEKGERKGVEAGDHCTCKQSDVCYEQFITEKLPEFTKEVIDTYHDRDATATAINKQKSRNAERMFELKRKNDAAKAL